MELGKAIEILTNETNEWIPGVNEDLINAIKLGIEALKRITKEREFPHVHIGTELPGETKE